MSNTVIVTRHPGLVAYLKETGLASEGAKVIAHVTAEEDIKGKNVIGVLPLQLASAAATVTVVPLNIPAELRGVELSLDQVREYAGKPERFSVNKTNGATCPVCASRVGERDAEVMC